LPTPLPLERVKAGGLAWIVVADSRDRRAWTNPVWW
jgi:hypothetical protein